MFTMTFAWVCNLHLYGAVLLYFSPVWGVVSSGNLQRDIQCVEVCVYLDIFIYIHIYQRADLISVFFSVWICYCFFLCICIWGCRIYLKRLLCSCLERCFLPRGSVSHFIAGIKDVCLKQPNVVWSVQKTKELGFFVFFFLLHSN